MQSLDRMRAHVEDLQDLGTMLDQSPRKFTISGGQGLRRTNSNWDYRTPPSNRKGRIVAGEDMVDLQRRLRRVQSNDTIGSKATFTTSAAPNTNPHPNLNTYTSGDGNATVNNNNNNTTNLQSSTSRGRALGRTGSALGFRDAEVREDLELAGLSTPQERGSASSFKQRLEQSRERQYRFGTATATKKRSTERWGRVGWFRGGGSVERERGYGKDERERDGWI